MESMKELVSDKTQFRTRCMKGPVAKEGNETGAFVLIVELELSERDYFGRMARIIKISGEIVIMG